MTEKIRLILNIEKEKDSGLYDFLSKIPSRHRIWELKKILSYAIEGKNPAFPSSITSVISKEQKKSEPKIPSF